MGKKVKSGIFLNKKGKKEGKLTSKEAKCQIFYKNKEDPFVFNKIPYFCIVNLR